MSQAQYTAISKMRLIDLHTLDMSVLEEYLSGKPKWLQDRVWEFYQLGAAL
ncbi:MULTISPECIES: hypothetical protein [Vibrio]|jgi:hypothetical protein|uniref:hypothetical protein n=1 Tax=Vibrio TaxID=662 RepID=UPI0013E98967|nr:MULTISPECIES: hypothetical protein [Vibrio]EIU6870697.1 hypothetical protein [Vibrio parahaemolyticus]EJG1399040.1 hypothetical protein [Vibrio parahaemolyticus]MBY7685795.1 hypothetical protein [Vibrio alginolyticus]MCR9634388.1 hypothetical protein [Vibrio alginolyticus]MCR9713921.1 hypothetical protein [Vibrio parahaemolyticus]